MAEQKEWNNSKYISMSFDLKVDEQTVDFFTRKINEIGNFEQVINARIKQLFDENIGVDVAEKGVSYHQVLMVFMLGYGHGWNDRKALVDIFQEDKK